MTFFVINIRTVYFFRIYDASNYHFRVWSVCTTDLQYPGVYVFLLRKSEITSVGNGSK